MTQYSNFECVHQNGYAWLTIGIVRLGMFRLTNRKNASENRLLKGRFRNSPHGHENGPLVPKNNPPITLV